jgi:hypothetical protein
MKRHTRHVTYGQLRQFMETFKAVDYCFDDSRKQYCHMLDNLEKYDVTEINHTSDIMRKCSDWLLQVRVEFSQKYGRSIEFAIQYLKDTKDKKDSEIAITCY